MIQLNFHEHFCPSNDVVFAVMFGKRELFCRLIQAVTGDKIELESDPHTQATLREDDALLSIIRFDTFAPTLNDRFYSLDMQRSYKGSRQERRTVYYACRAVSTQNVDDMAYEDLKPVHISFILTSHKDEKPIRHIMLCDTESLEIFDNLLELTLVYVPTVLKAYDKKSDLYIFARFFYITSQTKADTFVNDFGGHELGKELIVMYDNAVADAQDLQKIENRPYFMGRLTEAQLEEVRKKATIKAMKRGMEDGLKRGMEDGLKRGMEDGLKRGMEEGQKRGMEDGQKRGMEDGARKNTIDSAKRMLSLGLSIDIISKSLDLDIETIRAIES
jgi:predicted transposase/invertase (TIGR01784 family)